MNKKINRKIDRQWTKNVTHIKMIKINRKKKIKHKNWQIKLNTEKNGQKKLT